MRNLILSLLIIFSFNVISIANPPDTLFILQTTDVHGNIQDYDYFQDQPADYGLARIYTRVAEYRKKHANVLLVDGGDLIQGTPLAYYFNQIDVQVPHPMILTMNYMGYDAFTVGNHDIEQGLFVYTRAERESNFPWLSANSLLEDGRTFFKPYALLERNGIKIGIIGLTTPGIPMWLDENLYPGITWTDMVQSAKKYVKILRPKVDVLVGLFHAGFNEGYSAALTDAEGTPNENASRLVAEQVPGFDVIFAGHSHQNVPKEKITVKNKATLLVNAGSWGRNLGITSLLLAKDNRKILEKSAWLESMKEVAPSRAILLLNDYYHNKTLDYIRTEIAVLAEAVDASGARFADNITVELINKAQMNYTQADVSFAAAFNDRLKIEPGPIMIKDIYGMYRYENFLYTIEMSGQQIKDFLTYSARYFELDQGRIVPATGVPGYNYDMAEGLGYTIKVVRRKQDGPEVDNKIENLILLKTGTPLKMDKKYKVAMNSYRATGGGGHLAASGISKATILAKSNMEMRTILAEYIKKQKVIDTNIDNNWKLAK